MTEHFLNRTQVGAAFEQMRGEGVAQQMGVHPSGLEARPLGEPSQDQERPRG